MVAESKDLARNIYCYSERSEESFKDRSESPKSLVRCPKPNSIRKTLCVLCAFSLRTLWLKE
jgi:hypothetical protein